MDTSSDGEVTFSIPPFGIQLKNGGFLPGGANIADVDRKEAKQCRLKFDKDKIIFQSEKKEAEIENARIIKFNKGKEKVEYYVAFHSDSSGSWTMCKLSVPPGKELSCDMSSEDLDFAESTSNLGGEFKIKNDAVPFFLDPGKLDGSRYKTLKFEGRTADNGKKNGLEEGEREKKATELPEGKSGQAFKVEVKDEETDDEDYILEEDGDPEEEEQGLRGEEIQKKGVETPKEEISQAFEEVGEVVGLGEETKYDSRTQTLEQENKLSETSSEEISKEHHTSFDFGAGLSSKSSIASSGDSTSSLKEKVSEEAVEKKEEKTKISTGTKNGKERLRTYDKVENFLGEDLAFYQRYIGDKNDFYNDENELKSSKKTHKMFKEISKRTSASSETQDDILWIAYDTPIPSIDLGYISKEELERHVEESFKNYVARNNLVEPKDPEKRAKALNIYRKRIVLDQERGVKNFQDFEIQCKERMYYGEIWQKYYAEQNKKPQNISMEKYLSSVAEERKQLEAKGRPLGEGVIGFMDGETGDDFFLFKESTLPAISLVLSKFHEGDTVEFNNLRKNKKECEEAALRSGVRVIFDEKETALSEAMHKASQHSIPPPKAGEWLYQLGKLNKGKGYFQKKALNEEINKLFDKVIDTPQKKEHAMVEVFSFLKDHKDLTIEERRKYIKMALKAGESVGYNKEKMLKNLLDNQVSPGEILNDEGLVKGLKKREVKLDLLKRYIEEQAKCYPDGQSDKKAADKAWLDTVEKVKKLGFSDSDIRQALKEVNLQNSMYLKIAKAKHTAYLEKEQESSLRVSP